MYGPEEFGRRFRELPERSDWTLRERRRLHHVWTVPHKEPLPRPTTGHQRLALRYLKTGELIEAATQLDLDGHRLTSLREEGETDEQWLEKAEDVYIAYRKRLHGLVTAPRWRIYPLIADQYRVRAAQEAIFRPRRFWNWPPIDKR
jgi:hypothetical protein